MQPGQQHQQQQHGDRSNNAAGHRTDASGNQVGAFDIPIFTEEFLDHNKGMLLFFSIYIVSNGNSLLSFQGADTFSVVDTFEQRLIKRQSAETNKLNVKSFLKVKVKESVLKRVVLSSKLN